MRAVGRRPADELRARNLGEDAGSRRVVRVRVRNEYPADGCPSDFDDILDVRLDQRTWIDHGNSSFPEQIGIRARPGHQGWIWRDDAAHAGTQLRAGVQRLPESAHSSYPG